MILDSRKGCVYMMYGVNITEGPADWEILQQKEGYSEVVIKGEYKVNPELTEDEVVYSYPLVRVMREDDNSTVIPWSKVDSVQETNKLSGIFKTLLKIPAGGLYRIDTGLETRFYAANGEEMTGLNRGDCILHIGSGNLFIIAGQSNAAGYSKDFCMDPLDISVHLYRNRSRWDIASHPMNECTNATDLANAESCISGVSPYLSFGKCYAKITGMPVGLIQTALGGSVMDQWKPGTGELYQNLVEKIHQTKGAYAGILWYQGCSDTNAKSLEEPDNFSAAIHYLEHFKELVEAVRMEVGYEIPFFTMQLNRRINGCNDEAWGIVRDAQRKATKVIPNVYILPTTNLSLSDWIHNSAASNVVLGEKLAKQCAYVLDGKEEYCAPELVETGIVSEQNKKKLHFNGIWMEVIFSHVHDCLLVFSTRGEDSGFLLEDKNGEIKIEKIRTSREEKNRVYLKLERIPLEGALLSFAWEADPIKYPLIDEVTYLPPLSFYKTEISCKEIY